MEELCPMIQELLAGGSTVQLTVTGISMRPMLLHRRDQVGTFKCFYNLICYFYNCIINNFSHYRTIWYRSCYRFTFLKTAIFIDIWNDICNNWIILSSISSRITYFFWSELVCIRPLFTCIYDNSF